MCAARLLHITGPLSIESTLWFVCSSLMSLAFVGHLGALPLAAVVLANSVYNISGYSLVVGMAAGMNSLSGQVRLRHTTCARKFAVWLPVQSAFSSLSS